MTAQRANIEANNKTDFQIVKNILVDAKKAGVPLVIDIGTTMAENRNILNLAHLLPEVYAAVGLFPTEISSTYRTDIQELKKLINHYEQRNKIVAIGECGLDFHSPNYNHILQEDGFKAQIELALEENLALVIHSRNAQDRALRIMEEYTSNTARAVFHCFSEGVLFAHDVIERGFFLGIGGTVTYPKNDALRTVIKEIGLDHIVLETDAPYLPPQGLRGTVNHPQNITLIAHYLANFLNLSFKEVEEKTTHNAHTLFHLT